MKVNSTFGVLLFLADAVLLCIETSNSDANDFTAVLGGAALVSLGSIVLWILLTNWLKRKRDLEESKQDPGVGLRK